MFLFITFYYGLLSVFYAQAKEHWTVVDRNTNQTCIILDADSIPVDVKFTSKNGTVESYKTTISTPISVDGNCGAWNGTQNFQTLTVSFSTTNTSTPPSQPWELHLVFGSEEKTDFKLVDYWLVTANTPEMNASYIYNFTKQDSAAALQAHGSKAFKCSSTMLSLVNDSSVEMKDVRVIAFAALNGTEFSDKQVYDVCPFDTRTSDMVPIFVGACLVGLVVVVLIAYLIGRARAKRQGYASV